MILDQLKNSPEKMIPVAMALIVVGLSILMIGLAWPTFFPPVVHAGTNWSDFCRGFLFGLSIAMEITGVAITASAAAAKKRKAS